LLFLRITEFRQKWWFHQISKLLMLDLLIHCFSGGTLFILMLLSFRSCLIFLTTFFILVVNLYFWTLVNLYRNIIVVVILVHHLRSGHSYLFFNFGLNITKIAWILRSLLSCVVISVIKVLSTLGCYFLIYLLFLSFLTFSITFNVWLLLNLICPRSIFFSIPLISLN